MSFHVDHWFGSRFAVLALDGTIHGQRRVWEWTSTPARSGFVVRGGPWRNREGLGRADNRSWEDEPCVDVGFRVFYDATAST